MRINQRGLSLVEILASIAILSISALVTSSMISYVNSLLRRQQTKWTGSRIGGSVIQLAGLPATIRSSVLGHEENVELFKAITARTTVPHNGPLIPIRLFLPFVASVAANTTVTGGAMTGTPTVPVRYNLKGELCDMSIESCPPELWPVEIYTEYNLTCPPLFKEMVKPERYYGPIYKDGLAIPAQCNHPNQVRVKLTIRESLAPGGLAQQVKTINETLLISVSDINNRVNEEEDP